MTENQTINSHYQYPDPVFSVVFGHCHVEVSAADFGCAVGCPVGIVAAVECYLQAGCSCHACAENGGAECCVKFFHVFAFVDYMLFSVCVDCVAGRFYALPY